MLVYLQKHIRTWWWSHYHSSLSCWSPRPLSIQKGNEEVRLMRPFSWFWLINDPYFGAWFPLHHIWLLLWLWSMLGQKIMCQLHYHLLLCILPPHLAPSEVLTSLSLPFLLSGYFKSSSCASFLFHYHHPSAAIFGCGHLCLWLSILHLSCLPFTYVPVLLLAPNCTLVY